MILTVSRLVAIAHELAVRGGRRAAMVSCVDGRGESEGAAVGA
jgi:hypothetical protein